MRHHIHSSSRGRADDLESMHWGSGRTCFESGDKNQPVLSWRRMVDPVAWTARYAVHTSLFPAALPLSLSPIMPRLLHSLGWTAALSALLPIIVRGDSTISNYGLSVTYPDFDSRGELRAHGSEPSVVRPERQAAGALIPLGGWQHRRSDPAETAAVTACSGLSYYATLLMLDGREIEKDCGGY